MSKKLIYTLTLFVFIAMLGVFGFAVAPVSAQPAMQETVVVPPEITPIINTVVVPGATQLVPVTGDDTATTNIMMLLFYGFLGLLAVVLLVALLASANRTAYVRRAGPPPPPDNLP
ncbi:MAG: hypothetical protein ABI621_20685 [Chloroflexota bacterium]